MLLKCYYCYVSYAPTGFDETNKNLTNLIKFVFIAFESAVQRLAYPLPSNFETRFLDVYFLDIY